MPKYIFLPAVAWMYLVPKAYHSAGVTTSHSEGFVTTGALTTIQLAFCLLEPASLALALSLRLFDSIPQ